MTPDLARDDPKFELDVKVWQRYLVDWCHMPEEPFAAFVENIGAYTAAAVFHDFFRWEWFNYQCLHRAIYRDVDFDDTTDDDGEWENARLRAVTELKKHGFRLRDYSKQ